MERRQFVRKGTLAVVGAAAVAGCAEDAADLGPSPTPAKEKTPVGDDLPDLPVKEKSDELAAKIEAIHGEDIGDPTELAETLRSEGVTEADVTEESEGGYLSLEYVGEVTEEEGLVADVGTVAGAYAALVDAGFDGEALEVTVLDGEGRETGSYQIPTRWATEYNEGRVSAKEYGEMVVGTMETK